MKKFYEEIFKLKQILRTGWLERHLPEKGRVESVAEHIYSTSMLAVEIISREKLSLDEGKVFKMIACHELGEIDFGDHTPKENLSKEEKFEKELAGVKRISEECMLPEILDLWLEMEANKTPEAKFVNKLDKLDALLQCEIYSAGRPEVLEEFVKTNLEKTAEFSKYFTEE